MNLQRILVTIAITMISSLAHGQELFRLTFNGMARFVNEDDRLGAMRVTAYDLIARCVGAQALQTNSFGVVTPGFQLVYNASADSIQVVNATNGAHICDVLKFGAGVSNVDQRRRERLAFVFVPEDNTAVGSAILLERANRVNNRLSMRGQAQFVLTSLAPGSASGGSIGNGGGIPTNGTGQTNGTSVPTPVPALPGLPSVINDPIIGGTNISAPSLGTPGDSIGTGGSATFPDTSFVPGTNALDMPPVPSLSGSLSSASGTSAPGTLGTNIAPSLSLTPTTVSPSTLINRLTSASPAANVLQASTEANTTNVVIISATFSAGRPFTGSTNNAR